MFQIELGRKSEAENNKGKIYLTFNLQLKSLRSKLWPNKSKTSKF